MLNAISRADPMTPSHFLWPHLLCWPHHTHAFLCSDQLYQPCSVILQHSATPVNLAWAFPVLLIYLVQVFYAIRSRSSVLLGPGLLHDQVQAGHAHWDSLVDWSVGLRLGRVALLHFVTMATNCKGHGGVVIRQRDPSSWPLHWERYG